MIRFADQTTMSDVRNMWKVCFEDSEEFMDMYFSHKYRNENTLIYFDGETAVASIQMLPYCIRIYGTVVPVAYISGACTLPQFRGRGYMAKLIEASFEVMRRRNIPLSILIPAEEWLYGFYAKYGYEQTFDNGTDAIYMDTYLQHYPDNIDEAYRLFDELHQDQDFLMLKTKDDFRVILNDYVMYNCPAKYDLAGMTRVVDAEYLLGLYARRNPSENFSIAVSDTLPQNNNTYFVSKGKVETKHVESADFEVDIRTLTRLLFGYRTDELQSEYRNLFPQQRPVMNLMLE